MKTQRGSGSNARRSRANDDSATSRGDFCTETGGGAVRAGAYGAPERGTDLCTRRGTRDHRPLNRPRGRGGRAEPPGCAPSRGRSDPFRGGDPASCLRLPTAIAGETGLPPQSLSGRWIAANPAPSTSPGGLTSSRKPASQSHLPSSGRRDLNPRPPAPKAGALPGCATPRAAKGSRPGSASARARER